LAHGARRALDDRGDLVVRDVEHVVQDEREPLGRRERVEHDHQGQTDRVREQSLVFRIDRVGRLDDRVREFGDGLLMPGAPRAQHVQADAGQDGREPPVQIRHAGDVGPAGVQPTLLDRVLGLGQRAEHAVSDGSQARPVGVEPAGQALARLHVSQPRFAGCHTR
jgi:hypothetical protein